MDWAARTFDISKLSDDKSQRLLAEANAIRELENRLLPSERAIPRSSKCRIREEAFNGYLEILETRAVVISSQSREPGPWLTPLILESLMYLNEGVLKEGSDFEKLIQSTAVELNESGSNDDTDSEAFREKVARNQIRKAALAWLIHKGYDPSVAIKQILN